MSFYLPKVEFVHPRWNFPTEFGHRNIPAIATLITTGFFPPFNFQAMYFCSGDELSWKVFELW
jgi:hypothetical protein